MPPEFLSHCKVLVSKFSCDELQRNIFMYDDPDMGEVELLPTELWAHCLVRLQVVATSRGVSLSTPARVTMTTC